jgi:DNA-directed RNA polymerase specialized sigma24 family protein
MTTSTAKENEDLFRQITTGKKARQRFAEGNMAYVVTKVNSFINEHPELEYLREELISEGYLTLVQLANQLEEVNDNDFHPQALMWRALQNRFTDMVRAEKGEVELCEDLTVTGRHDAVDLQVDILHLCRDDTDRQIVKLRLQGYTDQEIADLLNLGRVTVTTRRSKLFKRYRETQ